VEGDVVGRSGTLYVVATPLGNLGDLSARATTLLREVPVVAAEDTRVTRGLLTHIDAHPKLISFHQHSDQQRAEQILARLAEGEDVALVTDAGTPGVSDPGPVLVEAVRAAGHAVVPIPGPSAVTAAISVSGFPADRYLFLGFAPRKGAERDRWLRQAATPGVTIVCFEAPGRTAELLEELGAGGASGRRACLGREITKLHEEFRVGTLSELATSCAATPPRGEITLVLAPLEDAGIDGPDPALARTLAVELLAAGRSKRDVVREVVDRTGLPRNEIYDLVMELSG
jgi:16S rRNA (cytidine1402-2'-O)-methyltransferase